MPPKHVGEELRYLVKSVRDGTFEYKNRDKTEINWAKYDSAQIKEMANYLNNLRDIVDEADNRIRSRTIPEKRGPGKPETNPADIAKMLLLQTYTLFSAHLRMLHGCSVKSSMYPSASFYLCWDHFPDL